MNIPKIISALPRFLRRHKLIKLLIFISPRSRIQLVEFNGSAKALTDLSDCKSRALVIERLFEPEFFYVAKHFLNKDGVFFDVGAHFGFCTFGMIGISPKDNIKYHLFEANRHICDFLLKSASYYPDEDIIVNNACVTDKDGTSRLKIVPDFSKSFISREGSQEVKNMTLDDYIHRHAIRKVDFLKMDIEGLEPLALRGAVKSLKDGIVDVLYIEVSETNLSRYGFSPRDILETLEDAGFRLFYCKQVDFQSGIADRKKIYTLGSSDNQLLLTRLDNFHIKHQTDILAIYKNAEVIQNIKEKFNNA